jgi:hypothetical protein
MQRISFRYLALIEYLIAYQPLGVWLSTRGDVDVAQNPELPLLGSQVWEMNVLDGSI